MKALGLGLLLGIACAAHTACARLVEEVVDVPVTVRNSYGAEFSRPIKLTVWRDDTRKASAFLVLNHGRPAQPGDMAKMGRQRYTDNSTYFVSRGFAVFVPTRMGYGPTGGEDVEFSGSDCGARNFPPAYEAAAEQSLRVIDYARAQSYVDPARGLVVGQSFGGATAIALAAKNPQGVVAAVNFAGGGGGNPTGRPERPCSEERLRAMFAGYGKSAKLPTLWLYSENDRYWGKENPQRWFEGFVKAGGKGEFVQLPPLMPPKGEDGHATFTRDPEVWRAAFEQFLKKIGF
jgi:dienelactone hydrolase